MLNAGSSQGQRLLMHNVEGHQAQRLLPVMAQQLQELVDAGRISHFKRCVV